MRNGINFIVICCCTLSPSLRGAPRDEYKRDFQKTAALANGRTLRVEHSLGNVNIRSHAANQVSIQAAIRCSARNPEEARTCTDRIQIHVDEGPSGVNVRTEYPRTQGRNNLSFSVDYEIAMPAGALLDLHNRFGSVTAANLGAAVLIHNANGRVTFTGGKGNHRLENSFGDVEVRTNAGDVTVRNANGNVTGSDVTGAVDILNSFGATRVTNAGRGLTIHSTNGNIDAGNVTGVTAITNTFGRVVVGEAKGDLTIDNQNGQVQVTGVTGSATLRTTFDKVTASRIGKGLVVRATNAGVVADTVGESAVVETTFGSVDLRGVKGGARVTAQNGAVRMVGVGGEVFAKSTFGGVDVSDAAGPVTVENQNGYVTAELRPGGRCQPVVLSTTFGPIRVGLPAGAGYNVTARTSFGRVHSQHEITISGDVAPTALTGRIGAGGCELRLTGQNGNIDILKGK